ncbi:MAG: YihY family inner membrane protein [Burkholderiales bacterium]
MKGFVGRVHSRLTGVGLTGTAASLAFMTLLGIVPLATVAFAVVAQFPVFQDWLSALEVWLARVLLPGVAGGGVVRNAITGFAEQAARLTGVTIAFVAVTAALLVATIEREINLIFGVRRARPLGRRLVVYALGVTLGPILVGASVSITSWLVARSLAAVPLRESLADWIGKPVPWLLSAVALTLVYKLAPACPVRWRHAATGGVLAALAFEVAKEGFAWYIIQVPTYRQIYGALAVLPLFMLWLYLCWMIVLVGAAIVSAFAPPGRGSRS